MTQQTPRREQADAGDSVQKTITVARDLQAAFRVWTGQIHRWWPAGHSISGDPATRVILEGREGGRFFERTTKGQEHDWGRVLVWEPPRRLVLHWYLGSGPQLPTRVEVRFQALDAHHTQVHVDHRGPDLIGDLWQRNVSRYHAGWDAVLRHFGEWAGDRRRKTADGRPQTAD